MIDFSALDEIEFSSKRFESVNEQVKEVETTLAVTRFCSEFDYSLGEGQGVLSFLKSEKSRTKKWRLFYSPSVKGFNMKPVLECPIATRIGIVKHLQDFVNAYAESTLEYIEDLEEGKLFPLDSE